MRCVSVDQSAAEREWFDRKVDQAIADDIEPALMLRRLHAFDCIVCGAPADVTNRCLGCDADDAP